MGTGGAGATPDTPVSCVFYGTARAGGSAGPRFSVFARRPRPYITMMETLPKHVCHWQLAASATPFSGKG